MEFSEFKRLVKKGEGPQLDFKREVPQYVMKELCKDIAAFANTDGGKILVGVDDKKNIVGVDWNQNFTAQVQQQGLNCIPDVAVSVDEIPAGKGVGMVVVITVPKTGLIHMDDRNRFPRRIANTTAFMDAMTVIALARERGIISSEQSVLNQQPYSRNKPEKVAFLGDYLSDKNPFIRLQAVSEIGNLSYRYAVEKIPNILEKLLQLVDDEVIDVQLATLNAVGNLNSRLDKKRREKFREAFREKLISLSTGKGHVSVRSRALQSLADFEDPKVIDILVKIVLDERAEIYAVFITDNALMRISEVGLGYALKERLLKEMSKSDNPNIQERFKLLLTRTNGLNWAT